ncbi:hypothetical protein [uncultured Jatrophihabitans sp.]|uniref:hypothetical protein n=1 Tax=uncultured Jatrophihabitans sp. TaxID=1610747 RepID=UPI0035CA8DEF
MNAEPVRSTVRLWQWVWPPVGIVLAGLGVVAASVDATGTALMLVVLAAADLGLGLVQLGRGTPRWSRR